MEDIVDHESFDPVMSMTTFELEVELGPPRSAVRRHEPREGDGCWEYPPIDIVELSLLLSLLKLALLARLLLSCRSCVLVSFRLPCPWLGPAVGASPSRVGELLLGEGVASVDDLFDDLFDDWPTSSS